MTQINLHRIAAQAWYSQEELDMFQYFFVRHGLGSPSPQQLRSWLKKEKIELLQFLGSGRYGSAFLVNSKEFGDHIVLKLSTHRNEKECAEWLQARGDFKHLPKIFKLEDLPRKDLDCRRFAFFYLRPHYQEVGPLEGEGQDSLLVKILKETGYQFWPWDLGGNEGRDPKTGELVYFDPACSLGFEAEHDIRDFMLDRLSYWGPEDMEEMTGLSLEDIRGFFQDDDEVEGAIQVFQDEQQS